MRASLALVLGLAVSAWAGPQDGDPILNALSQRQFDAALRGIDASLKANPADARLWMLRGAALYGLRRPKESLASYRKALQLQPDFMPALQAAAQIEYSTKDPNARKTLAKILSLEPGNEVAHAMAGVIAFEGGDCDTAVRHFTKAEQQVGRQRVSLQQYGYCLLRLNRGTDAAPVFQRLLAMDESDSKTRLNLVLALAAANRPVEAIEVMKPLAQASAPDADVLGLLGELYRANRQIEQAIAAFRRGIDLYPKEERLYIGLAALCSYYNSGDVGLEVVEIGLKNIPHSSRLYAMRGVLHSQMGRRDKAMADFERASELSGTEQIGRTGLELSLLQEGRTEELIRDARERVKRNPRDAAGAYMLAQSLLRRGSRPGEAAFTEARAALENAVRINPRSDRARALLGKVYFELGKQAAAIQELEAALKLQPDNRAAIYQLMLAYGSAGRERDAARLEERLRSTMEKERQEELERSRIRLMTIPEEK